MKNSCYGPFKLPTTKGRVSHMLTKIIFAKLLFVAQLLSCMIILCINNFNFACAYSHYALTRKIYETNVAADDI